MVIYDSPGGTRYGDYRDDLDPLVAGQYDEDGNYTRSAELGDEIDYEDLEEDE